MKDAFDVLSDVEHLIIQYEKVSNILHIYEEKVNEYVEFLESDGECSICKYIAAQYDTLRSLLEVSVDLQKTTNAELRRIIDSQYKQMREADKKQT
jgi:hypothetical protein